TLLRQFQIEVQVGIGIPHQEEELRGVGAHLVDHFAQRNKLACTLRHLHSLSATEEIHHLYQYDSQPVLGVAEGLDDGLHPGDIAMVVSSPDVDEQIIPTL